MVLTTLVLSTFFVPAVCSQRPNEISEKLVWQVQVKKSELDSRLFDSADGAKRLNYPKLTYLSKHEVVNIGKCIPAVSDSLLYFPVESYTFPTKKVKCLAHTNKECFPQQQMPGLYNFIKQNVSHIPFNCFYGENENFALKGQTLYVNKKITLVDMHNNACEHAISLEIQLASDFGNECPKDYQNEMAITPHYPKQRESELISAGIIKKKKDATIGHGPRSMASYFLGKEKRGKLKQALLELAQELLQVKEKLGQQEQFELAKQAQSEGQVTLDVVTPEQPLSSGENQKLEEEVSFLRSQIRNYQLVSMSIGFLALILYILHGPLPVAA